MEICFRRLLQLPRRKALDKGGNGGLRREVARFRICSC